MNVSLPDRVPFVEGVFRGGVGELSDGLALVEDGGTGKIEDFSVEFGGGSIVDL